MESGVWPRPDEKLPPGRLRWSSVAKRMWCGHVASGDATRTLPCLRKLGVAAMDYHGCSKQLGGQGWAQRDDPGRVSPGCGTGRFSRLYGGRLHPAHTRIMAPAQVSIYFGTVRYGIGECLIADAGTPEHVGRFPEISRWVGWVHAGKPPHLSRGAGLRTWVHAWDATGVVPSLAWGQL